MPAIDRLMALAVCGVIVACVLAGGCSSGGGTTRSERYPYTPGTIIDPLTGETIRTVAE